MRQAIDDLPSVSVSRLRALGEITPKMKTTTVMFGDVGSAVELVLFCWPNRGSWSFFLCPWRRRARILRLYEDGLACRGCLKARGLRHRVELVRTEKRAAYHLPRILARLNSTAPARLHPRPGRMLDRRSHLEAQLRRSIIVARQYELDEHDERLAKLMRNK